MEVCRHQKGRRPAGVGLGWEEAPHSQFLVHLFVHDRTDGNYSNGERTATKRGADGLGGCSYQPE